MFSATLSALYWEPTQSELHQFRLGYVKVLLVRLPLSKPFVLPHGLEPKSTL